jgi:hypothetical protein
VCSKQETLYITDYVLIVIFFLLLTVFFFILLSANRYKVEQGGCYKINLVACPALAVCSGKALSLVKDCLITQCICWIIA